MYSLRLHLNVCHQELCSLLDPHSFDECLPHLQLELLAEDQLHRFVDRLAVIQQCPLIIDQSCMVVKHHLKINTHIYTVIYTEWVLRDVRVSAEEASMQVWV